MTARIILTVLFGGAGIYAFFESRHFPDIAGYFPLFASAVAVIFAAVEAISIVYSLLLSKAPERELANRQSGVVEMAESALHIDADHTEQIDRTEHAMAAEQAEHADESGVEHNEGYYVLWIIGFVVLIAFLGAYVAIAVWLAAYGWRVWRPRWPFVVLGIVVALGLVYGLEWGGIIRVPYGLLYPVLFG